MKKRTMRSQATRTPSGDCQWDSVPSDDSRGADLCQVMDIQASQGALYAYIPSAAYKTRYGKRETYKSCIDRKISVTLRREPQSSLSRRHILALSPHSARSAPLARATERVGQGGKMGEGWTFWVRWKRVLERLVDEASFSSILEGPLYRHPEPICKLVFQMESYSRELASPYRIVRRAARVLRIGQDETVVERKFAGPCTRGTNEG